MRIANVDFGVLIVIADCGLRIADCGLRIADGGLRIVDVRQWRKKNATD
jgi:hypothetical protein